MNSKQLKLARYLILAVVFFAVLMTARLMFDSIWIRAGLAGCAFAILCYTMSRDGRA
jgi:hypothetical protein